MCSSVIPPILQLRLQLFFNIAFLNILIIANLNSFEYRSDCLKTKADSIQPLKIIMKIYINIGKLSEMAGYSIVCIVILLKCI